ncbi:hypothetical protein SAMN02745857_03306 [Andreprevotia lacus DSM 23236]|jgi:secreted PhoX family phosphatase|uniref:Tat (Twin-arginine translocation) pathway signal sequence n=1 Tax=Andreprevotia lacus DSM 23236 TaxID=1121001 RepID=A0A1W1XXF2_9NEIS|nr:PhoX family phosphatase [Andreprevotia lacus]SMC28552.1 hypothetical protein SAMN02745857_03306 [Andreprevotia lacus DSM 23236]
MTKTYADKSAACNTSDNPHFSSLIEQLDLPLSRRNFFAGGGALLAGLSLSGLPGVAAAAARAGQAALTPPQALKAVSLGFAGIPLGTDDTVKVPAGYQVQVLYAWGDPVGLSGNMPPFRQDASNSWQEQAAQAGMHHDGMRYFPLVNAGSRQRGLMAINHEYTDDGLLHVGGMANWNADKQKKAMAAHGVSVIEIEQRDGQWSVVRPSRYARRVTAYTPIALSGPAAGHALLRTADDASGREVLGTFANCANGWTPWGTYLTCEENWHGYFTDWSDNGDPKGFNAKRYGLKGADAGYRWADADFRFDAQLNPNEPNRFGWVVEIDPFEPDAKPVKRTALGRFKHEGACLSVAPSGQCVFYMGDDEKFEYIYKFVTAKAWNKNDRKANRNLLDDGTLYVARFNADGSGEWLELSHGKPGLTAEHGFADQGELLIKTRLAADKLGATKMDRPEWTAVNPHNPGEVFCTLTNNSDRGKEGKPGTDAANPRANNLFGHIIRWVEAGNDPTAKQFNWSIFALAGNPDAKDANHRGNIKGDIFGSQDGLYYAETGILWIQTDVSTTTINAKEYAGMGNNQMLAANPQTGEVRRFLVGPRGCELTGITFSADHKTLFVNIQHPGEPSSERSDPAKPQAISNWPDGPDGGRPRSATLAITRVDGGVIGI